MANDEEWGFVIVKKNDSIYAKNIRTDHNPDMVRPFYLLNLSFGEVVLGAVHIHFDLDSTGRSFVSGGDFEGLRYHFVQNYVSFIDAGNVRYAMVVENPTTLGTYLNSIQDKYYLNEAHYNMSLSDTIPGNWREKTQRQFFSLFGINSSTKGVGIYISTNSEKTSYIKLN